MSKGYQRIASPKEVKTFLKNAVSSKNFTKISVAKIQEDAQTRIEKETGIEVKRIVMDNYAVKHSIKRNDHHIDLSDFKEVSKIINSTKNITIQRNHMDNKAVLFTDERKNGLRVVMEIREKKGELALVTMYRPKKVK